MIESFDVVVIGGGTAGLVTASGCARLGRRVAMIEREELGGDCLWTGCVPTKALVATARLHHQMKHAALYGLPASTVQATPRAIMDSMREQRRIVSRHDAPEKFIALGIDVIRADAHLDGPRTVVAGHRTLRAKDIVIATGSRTAIPPVEGLAESGYLDHASFLDQNEFPARIVILGGGAIGLEFAQIFRRFGSEVIVVEAQKEILLREDPDVIACVRSRLESEGIVIRSATTVVRVTRKGSHQSVTVREGEREETFETDAVFVAAGRRGNIEGLGLESAGVATERSYVKVDATLATNVPGIWACGDIHGGLQFTHVAATEASVLVRNMLFPGRSKVDLSNVPWALFTDPEVAHLGMTEPEARAAHDGVRTWRTEMADVDRAVVDRTTDGFVKIITDRKGQILGAHIAATHASTMIETLVLARAKKVSIGALARITSPYPSLADVLQKTGSLYYQELARSALGGVARRIAGLWHR